MSIHVFVATILNFRIITHRITTHAPTTCMLQLTIIASSAYQAAEVGICPN